MNILIIKGESGQSLVVSLVTRTASINPTPASFLLLLKRLNADTIKSKRNKSKRDLSRSSIDLRRLDSIEDVRFPADRGIRGRVMVRLVRSNPQVLELNGHANVTISANQGA